MNSFLAGAFLKLLRGTSPSAMVPLVIFQAFGKGLPRFEVPWPFAAIFLPTDSESFALAMEINKTQMSERRGKNTDMEEGRKGWERNISRGSKSWEKSLV